MDRDLVYRISVANAAQSIRQIGSVADAIRRMLQQEVSLENAVAATKVAGAKKGAEGKKKAGDDALQHEAMLAKLAVNIEKNRARDITKQGDAAEKEKKRIAEKALKDAEKTNREGVKKFENAEKEKTKIVLREAKIRSDVEKAVGRAQQASAAHQLRESSQRFRKMERDSAREDRDRMFDRKRLFRGVGQAVVNGAWGAAGGAASAFTSVASRAYHGARSVVGSLGMDEAVDVGGIFSERMKIRQGLRYIEQESGGRVKGGDAERAIRRAALMTGRSESEVYRGVDKASEMGDPTRGVQNIGQVAKEAKAYDADIADIMMIRSQAIISAEQSGESLSDKDLNLMVAKIAHLGKSGTMRISDFAKRAPQIFSRWTASGQSMKGGALDEMVGFAQMAKSTTGGSAEAKTAMRQVQNAIIQKEDKFKALGIDVRDKEGNQYDPLDVAMQAIAKTGGYGPQFFGKHGVFDTKAMGGLVPLINAAKGGKTEKERMSLMRAALSKASNTSGVTEATTDKEFAGAMDTQQSKLEVAKIKIRQSLEDALTPAFEKLATKLPQIIDTITGAIAKIAPILEKLGANLASVWKVIGPIVTPTAGKAMTYAAENPLLAIGLAGAARTTAGTLGGGAKTLAGAGARWVGDRLAQAYGGGVGAASKALGGAVGGAIGAAGSTPVYVTGAAPGVMGGGGGMPGVPGGAGMAALGPIAAVAAAGIVALLVAEYTQAHPNMTGETNDDGSRRYTKSDAAYKAGIAEIQEDKAKRDSGMLAILDANSDRNTRFGGLTGDEGPLSNEAQDYIRANKRETPEELAKKQAIAYKYFPDLAAKVASGEVSDADAAKSISASVTGSGLAGKVGANGMFESGPSAANAQALNDAFASIAKQAKEAATAMGELSAKAGGAGNNVSKIKLGAGVPGAGGT